MHGNLVYLHIIILKASIVKRGIERSCLMADLTFIIDGRDSIWGTLGDWILFRFWDCGLLASWIEACIKVVILISRLIEILVILFIEYAWLYLRCAHLPLLGWYFCILVMQRRRRPLWNLFYSLRAIWEIGATQIRFMHCDSNILLLLNRLGHLRMDIVGSTFPSVIKWFAILVVSGNGAI